jgi:DNA-directed RNA polymerase subunit E'
MYYVKVVEDRIRLMPAMLASDLEDAVLRLLRDKFERRIFREAGIILSVDNVKVLTEGTVIPGDSGIYYTVSFDALTFMPQVNEVYEAEVKEIVEFGAFSSLGALQGLLHVSQISKDKFYYDKKTKALSSRERKSIKKGDEIVVKVSTVSLKANMTETKIGLTMRPEGLGKKEWLEEKKKEKKEEKPEKKEKGEKKKEKEGKK